VAVGERVEVPAEGREAPRERQEQQEREAPRERQEQQEPVVSRT